MAGAALRGLPAVGYHPGSVAAAILTRGRVPNCPLLQMEHDTVIRSCLVISGRVLSVTFLCVALILWEVGNMGKPQIVARRGFRYRIVCAMGQIMYSIFPDFMGVNLGSGVKIRK